MFFTRLSANPLHTISDLYRAKRLTIDPIVCRHHTSLTQPPTSVFVGCVCVCVCTARFVYLLGADDEDVLNAKVPAHAFVVYQGHHGDAGANRADVILPSPAYTEKDATYVNLEGRVQRTKAATPILKNAREDW